MVYVEFHSIFTGGTPAIAASEAVSLKDREAIRAGSLDANTLAPSGYFAGCGAVVTRPRAGERAIAPEALSANSLLFSEWRWARFLWIVAWIVAEVCFVVGISAKCSFKAAVSRAINLVFVNFITTGIVSAKCHLGYMVTHRLQSMRTYRERK